MTQHAFTCRRCDKPQPSYEQSESEPGVCLGCAGKAKHSIITAVLALLGRLTKIWTR